MPRRYRDAVPLPVQAHAISEELFAAEQRIPADWHRLYRKEIRELSELNELLVACGKNTYPVPPVHDRMSA